jgi:hypothetical protein
VPETGAAWEAQAPKLRKTLGDRILGGLSGKPAPNIRKTGPLLRFQTEPGLDLFAMEVIPQKEKSSRVAIFIGLDDGGNRDWTNADFQPDPWRPAGWRVWGSELRATRSAAWPSDTIGAAPDHNTAQWGLWIGRPLLGQWVHDVRRVLDVMEEDGGKLPSRIAVVGKGPAGIVALCAAAVDPRITDVVAIDALASYITESPYKNQRLGLMAPGILRDVGDVAHVAALCLPRRVVIAGGVFGDGKKLTAEQRQKTFEPAAQVGRLLRSDGALQLLESSDTAAIVKALR